MRRDGSSGFTKSFFITRHDVDFYLALNSMLEARGTNRSSFILFCLKYVVLNQGHDFFDDFQEHYRKIIEAHLDDTFVKYKGKKMKLGDLVESELIKESGFVKI